ncbi:MAG: hypothetical protein AB1798_21055, partial [Spirochaetota bacterium]
GAEILSPLDAAIYGGFRELVQSLFTFYQDEPITIIGFEAKTSTPEDFADFIVKTIREKSGQTRSRWFRFTGRQGFLPLILPGIKSLRS